MKSLYLPPCCTPPTRSTFLPALPSTAVLFRCTFNAEHWAAEHSALAGAPPIEGAAKRQAEFLAGRLCAREALAALTGQGLMVGKAPSGAPAWPQGFVGSISHSQDHAVALVAPASTLQSVGIDLETLMPQARADRLAAKLHPAAEYLRRQALPEDEQAFYSSVSFSLKESLFKALYPLVQKRFYFHDAELVSYHADGRATLRLLTDLNATWRAGMELAGQFSLDEQQLLSAVLIAR